MDSEKQLKRHHKWAERLEKLAKCGKDIINGRTVVKSEKNVGGAL